MTYTSGNFWQRRAEGFRLLKKVAEILGISHTIFWNIPNIAEIAPLLNTQSNDDGSEHKYGEPELQVDTREEQIDEMYRVIKDVRCRLFHAQVSTKTRGEAILLSINLWIDVDHINKIGYGAQTVDVRHKLDTVIDSPELVWWNKEMLIHTHQDLSRIHTTLKRKNSNSHVYEKFGCLMTYQQALQMAR